MTCLQKTQPFLLLIAIGLGLGLAQVSWLSELAAGLIVPLLALMLYATFLPVTWGSFRQTFAKTKVVLTSLAINFLWTPILAWTLGALFLRESVDVWVGLLMLMVTPCTDWYLVFTGVAGGDVALATALLPVNLTLQVLLLPVYLLIFVGMVVEVDPLNWAQGLFFSLGIPLILARISQETIIQLWGEASLDQVSQKIGVVQLISLNLAVVCIFAAKGHMLGGHLGLWLQLLAPVSLFFLINLLLAYQAAQLFRLSYPEFACLSCTTLARNSPLSLAIAATVFPDRPLITLTLVIGPLIELPVLTLLSQLLLQIKNQPRIWSAAPHTTAPPDQD
ncbi:MAG: hypothetical protein Q6L49_03710 [Thermostichales cyanobacterium HHBFW_bins_127]